ncbi:cubilin-like [Mizuhopecten yessoensis]|uniref:Cubilin n=1 Tax=Mizuhopecten yessoensis TaxID=6573 RepID=A0A210R268_MIZYE|nr:cubilin-like [Mizuhopecten yessoensis]OWF55001.1 Cubilin [Mizuhopecten yessoensis]
MKIGTVWMLVAAGLAAVSLSESALLDLCGGQYNASVDSPINVNFSDITNQTCVWYIQRDSNNRTNLFLSISFLDANSSIIVYSGHYYKSNSSKANIIKTYKAGDTASEQVVISASKVTSIVFQNKNSSQGSLLVDFNAGDCTKEIEWTKPIVSPIYLPGTGPVKCVYQMTLPTDSRTSVMSFTDFSLVKGSLIVENGKISHTLKGINVPQDLLLGTNGNLSLTIALENNTASQHFKAFMMEADPVCTRQIDVNDSQPFHFSLPSTPSFPLDCLVIVTSPLKTTLVAMVKDLVLAGGGDSVTLRDGGSQSSPQIASLVSNSQNGQLIITSGNKMLVQIRLETSLAIRIVKLDLKHQGGGAGRYSGSGNITLNASQFVPNNSVYFLVTVPDSRAHVTFLKGNLNKATLEVYDDNTPSKEIAVFKKLSDFYTVTGSGQSILIKATNFVGLGTFTASYRPVTPACDQLSTGPYGSYSMIGKSGTQCTWSIRPQGSAWLLDLTMGHVTLCQNDTLAVYEGLTKTNTPPIITVNMKTQNMLVPVIYSQSQSGFRMVLNSPKGSCSANMSSLVTASYQTNMAKCGTTLNAVTGIVISPQFPNQYPLNAHCKWTFVPNKKPFILVSVDSLNLNPKHSLTLDDGKKVTSLTGYTNTDLLVPTTNKSNLVLDFNSVNSNTTGVPTTGRGFVVKYTYLDCGGEMKDKSSGKIDVGPAAKNTSRLCVWLVQALKPAKGNNSNILSLNISITGNTTQDIVKIYDGGSMGSPPLKLNMTKGLSPNTLTRGSYVMIVYTHNGHMSKLEANSTFHLKINYTTYPCPPTQKCQNGKCIHPDWYCNGINDCGDNTDELNCTYPVPIPTTPKPTNPPKKSTGVKSYVVVIVALVCLALGVVLAMAVPALYKRIKYPNYRHLQDLSVTT